MLLSFEFTQNHYIIFVVLLNCFAYTITFLYCFVILRNKAPLRLTANKAGEDVTGSIQMCTLVGYHLKFCAMPGFDTIGFRTTVTKRVVMQGLGVSRRAVTSSQTFG